MRVSWFVAVEDTVSKMKSPFTCDRHRYVKIRALWRTKQTFQTNLVLRHIFIVEQLLSQLLNDGIWEICDDLNPKSVCPVSFWQEDSHRVHKNSCLAVVDNGIQYFLLGVIS